MPADAGPLGFVKPFIRLTLESSPAGVPRLRREREYQCLRSLQGLRGRRAFREPFAASRQVMLILYERCAAVDVGKDVIAIAVRLPGG